MKRFVLKVLLFSMPILVPGIFYFVLFLTRENSGDIGSMAKIFFEKGYHNKLDIDPDPLFAQDIEIQDLPDSSTILCFGDSFSAQRPFPYLQPLGEYCNKKITNVLYNVDISPEDAALGFLANAPQAKMPKIIIVESIERSVAARLFWIDTSYPLSMEQIQKGKKHRSGTPKKSFCKELTLFYKFRLGWDNKIVSVKLNKPCFSSKGNECKLYSYYEDTIHYSKEFIDSAANKLCQLRRIAQKRNIELIYIAVPNKSTLYAPYSDNRNKYFTIEDNPAFDTLPFYFNPIKILRELDEKGEKDIYYSDDTHWTPKTAKTVGEALIDKIIKQYGNTVK